MRLCPYGLPAISHIQPHVFRAMLRRDGAELQAIAHHQPDGALSVPQTAKDNRSIGQGVSGTLNLELILSIGVQPVGQDDPKDIDHLTVTAGLAFEPTTHAPYGNG